MPTPKTSRRPRKHTDPTGHTYKLQAYVYDRDIDDTIGAPCSTYPDDTTTCTECGQPILDAVNHSDNNEVIAVHFEGFNKKTDGWRHAADLYPNQCCPKINQILTKAGRFTAVLSTCLD